MTTVESVGSALIAISLIGIVFGIGVMVTSNAADTKFAISNPSDACPGVPQLNQWNDSTLAQSVEYGICLFPTKREQEEGCVDWHKTRLNFERKCEELQSAQKVKPL